MKYLHLFLSLFCAAGLHAQSSFTRISLVDTDYTAHPYGFCNPVQTTADGGHLLPYFIGISTFPGPEYTHSMFIKTDSDFRPQWYMWTPTAPLTLSDGSIFTFSYPSDTPGCAAVQKLDMAGNVTSSRILCKDENSTVELGSSVLANSRISAMGIVRSHGGPVSWTAPVLVEMDTMGNLISADSLAGDTTAFEHMFADDSGNYYIVLRPFFGRISSSITKLSPTRTVIWSYSMPFDRADITAMVTLPNGDAVFAGNFWSGSSARVVLMKISASGHLIWQKRSGRPCQVTDMTLTPQGDIILAAGGLPAAAFTVLAEDNIIKIDTAGNVKWARNMDPDRTTWPFYTGLSAPYVGVGGKLVFFGVSRWPHSVVTFTTDSLGNGICTSSAISMSFADTLLFPLTPGTIDLAPVPLTSASYTVPAIAKPVLYVDTCDYYDPSLATGPLAAANVVTIYPDPAAGTIYISSDMDITRIEVVDLTGKLIKDMHGPQRQVDISQFQNGHYIVRMTDRNNVVYYRRLVVIN